MVHKYSSGRTRSVVDVVLKLLTITFLLYWLSAASGAQSLPKITASLDFDRTDATIKEQILVTLKIGYPPGAFGMTHTPLSVSNADIHPLKKTKYTANVNGVPYSFVETRYAMFGNAAGTINVSAMKFDAVLPVSAGNSANPKITSHLKPRTLVVHVLPEGDKTISRPAYWLAASDVAISADWLLNDEIISPGLPIQRQVNIKIVGQHPAAVPARLEWNLPDGLRAYQSEISTSIEKSAEGLGGTVTMPVKIVASRDGSFVLPKISVPWWDIEQRQWRQATLPAETIDIVNPAVSTESSILKVAAMALGMICIGLALWGYVLWRKLTLPRVYRPERSERKSWNRLRKTIKQKQLVKLRSDLLEWGRALYSDPSINRLDQLYVKHSRLRSVIEGADGILYGTENTQMRVFDFDDLWLVLNEMRESCFNSRKDVGGVRSLYPLT